MPHSHPEGKTFKHSKRKKKLFVLTLDGKKAFKILDNSVFTKANLKEVVTDKWLMFGQSGMSDEFMLETCSYAQEALFIKMKFSQE